jgi:hypothetical protein
MYVSLPVPMAARITKYLNKYVRTGLCEHIVNTSYFNLPSDIGFTLFTPIKGRIYSQASHFSSVIGSFRSSGWLDLHV